MGVQLRLQHADLGFVQVLLILHEPCLILHQRRVVPGQRRGHVVEAARQLAQLIVPGLDLNVQVVKSDPAHGVPKPLHRTEQLVSEHQAQDQRGDASQKQSQDADGPEAADRIRREHLGPLQDRVDPAVLLLGGRIGKSVRQAVRPCPPDHRFAEEGRKLRGESRPGAVYGTPETTDQDQLVLCAVFS